VDESPGSFIYRSNRAAMKARVMMDEVFDVFDVFEVLSETVNRAWYRTKYTSFNTGELSKVDVGDLIKGNEHTYSEV